MREYISQKAKRRHRSYNKKFQKNTKKRNKRARGRKADNQEGETDTLTMRCE